MLRRGSVIRDVEYVSNQGVLHRLILRGFDARVWVTILLGWWRFGD